MVEIIINILGYLLAVGMLLLVAFTGNIYWLILIIPSGLMATWIDPYKLTLKLKGVKVQ